MQCHSNFAKKEQEILSLRKVRRLVCLRTRLITSSKDQESSEFFGSREKTK